MCLPAPARRPPAIVSKQAMAMANEQTSQGAVAITQRALDAVNGNRAILALRDMWSVEKYRERAARSLVSVYFLNVWLTHLQMWTWQRESFPFVGVFLILPAICLIADFRAKLAGWVLLADVSWDSVQLLFGVYKTWLIRGTWYLNELMVKKLSMMGACCLVLLMAYGMGGKSSLAGLLMPELSSGPSTKQSAVLLVSRLLLTSLFIWAGQAEIVRQLASVHSDGQGHQVHDRPVGDGHDQLWAKSAQFICSLPLCFGFKTSQFCTALAVICCLEAVLQWSGLHWYFRPKPRHAKYLRHPNNHPKKARTWCWTRLNTPPAAQVRKWLDLRLGGARHFLQDTRPRTFRRQRRMRRWADSTCKLWCRQIQHRCNAEEKRLNLARNFSSYNYNNNSQPWPSPNSLQHLVARYNNEP